MRAGGELDSRLQPPGQRMAPGLEQRALGGGGEQPECLAEP